MKDEIKSFYTAVIMSLAVIFIFNYLFFGKKDVQIDTQVKENAVEVSKEDITEPVSSQIEILTVDEALKQSPRINISNQDLKGSLRLTGNRIDSLYLRKYKQTQDENSGDVELFMPSKTSNPYYAEFGWLASDNKTKLPKSDTLWTVKGAELTPQTPVVLEWDNGEGLRFITKISLDDNYMFTINQSVENNTANTITLYPYGLIARDYDPKAKLYLMTQKSRIDLVDRDHEQKTKAGVVHEGLIGVFNDKLEEIKFKDLEKKDKEFETTSGWFGFSDRYWFSSIILDNQQPSKIKLSQNGTFYQSDFVGAPIAIAPGSVGTFQEMLFAGAKEIKLLDKYADNLHIGKFDLAVDFGWYYFLTKPFFYILDYLYKIIGNMGWAILLFAALLRLVMFPIANKSYENMAKMKKLQPKLKELQEKYAEDKMKLQQETMFLYKKEKINPASGCLPMFIQIPVFFSLYKVLNIAIEIRHAPFIGWIKDLSAPDPLLISDWAHIPLPSVLDIGVWPIIMGITMYIQQKMNPAPTNKDQARAFALLPLIFTFMMGHFAAGLVIYWSFSNILSIIQQRVIIHRNKD